jgi:DNA primase
MNPKKTRNLRFRYDDKKVIGEDDIRRVREATDLVVLVSENVVLKQRGREFWGCCPFHDERTPSFKVDSASGLYHCFGCGAGGDAYKFVMQTQNLEFIDAVRYLAQRANIVLQEDGTGLSQGKRARLLDICQKTAEFYHQQLMRVKNAGADAARAYLGARDLGGAVAKDWQLGYAPGRQALVHYLQSKGFKLDELLAANVAGKGQSGRVNDRFYERVMFPIFDLQGRAVAFGGRIIAQGEPKYINSSDTPLFHKRETLYAIDKAKSKITTTGIAIVVEGYTDTIAMHRAGFTNVVATLGTALTPEHLKLLNRFAKKVIYLFDGDEAGQRAATRASELITKDITPEAGKLRVELLVAVLPAGVDPADFLANNAAEASAQGEGGQQAMQQLLDGAQPLLKFAINRSLAGKQLATPEQRSVAIKDALQVLLPIRGSLLATDYLGELASLVGSDVDSVKGIFDSLPAPRQQTYAHAPAPVMSGAAAAQTTMSVTAAGGGGGVGGGGGTQATAQGAAQNAELALSKKEATLQADLLMLYIEEPQVRELLGKAFARIEWQGALYQQMAAALLAADTALATEQLYSLAVSSAEGAGQLMSAGLNLQYTGEVVNHAKLLMYLLREQQLLNVISQAKIAYKQAVDKDAASTAASVASANVSDTVSAANQLFRDIAALQTELKGVQEKLVRLPKSSR